MINISKPVSVSYNIAFPFPISLQNTLTSLHMLSTIYLHAITHIYESARRTEIASHQVNRGSMNHLMCVLSCSFILLLQKPQVVWLSTCVSFYLFILINAIVGLHCVTCLIKL